MPNGRQLLLRLVDPVTKAAIHYQFRGHPLIEQPLVQLVGILNRDSPVELAVLNQGRRLGLLDGRHRRGLLVDRHVVPRRGLEILPRERIDVRRDVIGHPIRDPGADRNGFEPGRIRGQERRDVPALAPAHRGHFGAVDHALFNQVVNPRHHVPHVPNPEVPNIERSELLAVTRRPPVIRPQHQGALRHPLGNRIDIEWRRLRIVDARRPAVNHHEQWVFLPRLPVLRFVENSLDDRPVTAGPAHDLVLPHVPGGDLRSEVGQFLGPALPGHLTAVKLRQRPPVLLRQNHPPLAVPRHVCPANGQER